MRSNLLWTIRLFLVLSLCVLLFFCLLLSVYDQMSAQIREEAIRRQETYLQRGAAVIDSGFSAYWGKQLPLLQQSTLVAEVAALDSITPSDHARMLKLRTELSRILGVYDASNPFLLVFTCGDGLAFSTQAIYHNLRESVSMGNVSLGEADYGAFVGFLEQQANAGYVVSKAATVSFASSADLVYGHGQARYLCVVRKLNMGTVRCGVYALWLYSLDVLHDTLSGESRTNDFFALKRRDELVHTNRPNAPLDQLENGVYYDKAGRDTYFSVQLPSLGLTAYLSLNDEVVLAHLARFALLWKVLLAAFALLSATLAILLVFYLVKPLRRLYARVFSGAEPVRRGGTNIFSQMEGRIAEMGNDRRRLNQQLLRWQALLHKNLLHKLLRGDPVTPAEAEVLGGLPDISAEEVFRVALIGVLSQSPQLSTEFAQKIEQVLEQALPTPLYAWMGPKQVALLLPEGSVLAQALLGQRSLRGFLGALYEALTQCLSDPNAIALGVGLGHAGIHNAGLSYREAKKAFREAELWKRSALIYYESDAGGRLRYGIAYEDLVKLQNLLETGQSEEACAFLDTLAGRLLGEDPSAHPEERIISQFAHDIYGVALRISSSQREPSILASFPAYEEFMPLQAWLAPVRSSFQYIAEVVASRRDTDNTFSNALLAYLTESYRNPGLSLSVVADAFSMSERSLSRYFKDKMEDTFSNILEKFRLSEAERLLLQSGGPLREIATRVGYANLTTFLKAFKRRHGLNPTDWVRKNTAALPLSKAK